MKDLDLTEQERDAIERKAIIEALRKKAIVEMMKEMHKEHNNAAPGTFSRPKASGPAASRRGYEEPEYREVTQEPWKWG